MRETPNRATVNKITEQLLLRYGLNEPMDLLNGLLQILGENHIEMVAIRGEGTFNDGLDEKTGKHAVSLADSIRNLAQVIADRGQLILDQGYRSAEELGWYENHVAQVRAVADTLGILINRWEAEAKGVKAMAYREPVR